jgi:autotransporter-associated beta strand protein
MSIDTNFDASILVDSASVGILALNTNNSTLSGTSGSSAFIGAFGAESLTSTMLAPGAGNTYRLGGRGGALTVSNGVLTDSAGPVSNSLLVGSSQPNGSGTVILAAVNTFSGGTTVNNGTLQTTADGALGSGGLAVNAASAAVSLASLQSNEVVSSLSSAISGGGTANLTVAAGKSLTDNQSTSTSFQGTVNLSNGTTAHSGGTLTKSGGGTLEVDGAPSLGPNSNINVNAGKLKFNVNSGSVFVGTGVLVTVTGSTGNLELAGSESALDPLLLKGRADILNNSTAAAGVLISGIHQQVGSIDGAGTTQVDAGSDLTANHIVQGSLIIGGTAGNPGRVTIDASDSSGNPLASGEASGGFAIAGSVSVGGPFDLSSTDSVLATEAVQSGHSVAVQLGAGGSSSVGGNLTTVPEPSSILLAAVGALALGIVAERKRLLKSRP